MHFVNNIIQFSLPIPSDIELGNGSAPEPRIYMPNCKNCNDIELTVAAKEGSIYMMYREYKVKEGAVFKMSPIIVRIYCNITSQ